MNETTAKTMLKDISKELSLYYTEYNHQPKIIYSDNRELFEMFRNSKIPLYRLLFRSSYCLRVYYENGDIHVSTKNRYVMEIDKKIYSYDELRTIVSEELLKAKQFEIKKRLKEINKDFIPIEEDIECLIYP